MAVGNLSSSAAGGSSHRVTMLVEQPIAAAVGQVAAVRILHAFPVVSYCCLLVDHCLRYVLQQPPEHIPIRPAKEQYLKEFWYVICPEM